MITLDLKKQDINRITILTIIVEIQSISSITSENPHFILFIVKLCSGCVPKGFLTYPKRYFQGGTLGISRITTIDYIILLCILLKSHELKV